MTHEKVKKGDPGPPAEPRLRAVFNEPFSIHPHFELQKLRFKGDERSFLLEAIDLSIEGVGGVRHGEMEIRGGRTELSPFLPEGPVTQEMEIDPKTGLYLPKRLPLWLDLRIGNISHQEQKEISVSILYGDKSYEAELRHITFGFGVNIPGVLDTLSWSDSKTSGGIPYFPSEKRLEVFDKLKILIKHS